MIIKHYATKETTRYCFDCRREYQMRVVNCRVCGERLVDALHCAIDSTYETVNAEVDSRITAAWFERAS